MSSDAISAALLKYGLLDDEGFLLPPEHPSIKAFQQRIGDMLELKEQGLNFSQEQKQEFRTMMLAFDYYNEVLHELEEDGDFIDDDDEEDEDDDEEDEESTLESQDSDEDD